MKYLKSFLFFLLAFNLHNSQSNIAEILTKYNYLELEDKFYDYKKKNKIEQSQMVAEFYLQKAKKEKSRSNIAEGYVLIQYNKKLSTALKYLDSLEVVSKNLTDDRYPARIYLLRGILYFNFDNQQFALENFVIALKYAKEKNNERQIAIADLQIAFLNNYIGKHNEAFKTFKFYYDNPDLLGIQDIEHVKFNLADTYLDLYENDKAIKLIEEGLQSTLKNHEEEQYNRYLILLGEYNLNTKHYSDAIINLEKCKKYFLKNNIDLNANYAMLYLGQSYAKSNNKDKAVENFIKIDSIIQKTNNTFPELREVYTYLIDYCKGRKDKEKQLYYIERFLKVDKTLDAHFKYISREIPKKYDTPKLLSQKEEIIQELKNKKLISFAVMGLLCLMVFTLLFLFIKAKRKEKKYKANAQELVKSVNENRPFDVVHTEESISGKENEIFDSEKNNLSEDIVSQILLALKTFEEKEQYLKKGITLTILAKKIKTNSSYLSQVVNTYKKKTFAIYLNDLRIDYALIRLVNDKIFRSYKLSVIAEELGYNNEQAFAMAFKRKTGTTLSAYLKEIENQS